MRGLWLLLVVLPAAALQDTSLGKKLYDAHCSACHGRNGEGGRGARLTIPVRAPDADSLAAVIQKGIPGTEMPPAPFGERDVRDVAAFVRTLQQDQPAGAASGDARGAGIYRRSGCARCHAIGGQGGALGPDLSDVGRRRVPDYLRRALLDPEADIADSFSQYRWVIAIPDNFVQVRAITRDGREIRGARINEDPFSIQMRDSNGRLYSFWKDELKELRHDWGKSPMPGFKDKLSPAELDDLVSYLSSLRGAR
jgi:putative heme-binding domain-containing protein